MTDDLLKLVKGAKRILITSHISPDPDALCSTILLGMTLELNFPSKKILMNLEERPSGLDFIEGIEQAEFAPVASSVEQFKPDLFILLDGNNYDRCSRLDGQRVRDYLRTNRVKTAVIDHHELAGKDEVDVFINHKSPAVAQDIYEACFRRMGLKKPSNADFLAMVGFYADTGGFVYIKPEQSAKAFKFAEELVANGVNVEAIKNNLESYTEDDLKVIAEFMSNIGHGKDYTYSFLSDAFVGNWLKSGHTHSELQRPSNAFLNGFIRNIGGRRWGFTVLKNILEGDNFYSVSYRSQDGKPDVSVMATKLGGGGHKPAAGAKFSAKNVEDALRKVRAAINGSSAGAVDED